MESVLTSCAGTVLSSNRVRQLSARRQKTAPLVRPVKQRAHTLSGGNGSARSHDDAARWDGPGSAETRGARGQDGPPRANHGKASLVRVISLCVIHYLIDAGRIES